MSHPNPSHEKGNEYPEDKVSSYGTKKKSLAAKHSHIQQKTGHLRKAMNKLGGRFTHEDDTRLIRMESIAPGKVQWPKGFNKPNK